MSSPLHTRRTRAQLAAAVVLALAAACGSYAEPTAPPVPAGSLAADSTQDPTIVTRDGRRAGCTISAAAAGALVAPCADGTPSAP